MSRFSLVRAGLVLLGIGLFLVGMTGRVVYLQTWARQKLIRAAERQQHTNETILAARGSIFDRNGLKMAGTIQTLAAYVDPKFMLEQYQKEGRNLNQMDMDLAKLAGLTGCDADALVELVSEKRSGARYVKIVTNLTEAAAEQIRKLDIPGVGVELGCDRHYPMGQIAAHVLGSVGAEGQGLEGLELKFNKELAGRNGFKRVEKDARQRPIGIEAGDYIPPEHGKHLVLSIDANLQMLAEQELSAACNKYKAKRGEVILMDPHTGDVLAMASWPTFSPEILEATRAEERLNRCIVVPYEPGSTLKPFIAGPALAQRITRMSEVWPIHGLSWQVPNKRRRVTDVHHYGPLCTWDVLVKSSNIGMCMMAQRMGNAKLWEALSTFGFGRRTGIELPGEDPGRLFPLKKWNSYSTESIAQGYEMMVTPLQLARAFCVYANGGRLVRPRLVQGIVGAEGQVIPRTQPVDLKDMPQVISEEAALQMRQILSDVLVRGTGTKARSEHWNFFGKTGTAHVSQGKHGYSSALFNSSFIAGAPLEKPQIVVAMVIHEADRSLGHYGGTVSAPAAGRLLERALAYLQVPASPPIAPPPPHIIPLLHNYNARLYKTPETASARP